MTSPLCALDSCACCQHSDHRQLESRQREIVVRESRNWSSVPLQTQSGKQLRGTFQRPWETGSVHRQHCRIQNRYRPAEKQYLR